MTDSSGSKGVGAMSEPQERDRVFVRTYGYHDDEVEIPANARVEFRMANGACYVVRLSGGQLSVRDIYGGVLCVSPVAGNYITVGTHGLIPNPFRGDDAEGPRCPGCGRSLPMGADGECCVDCSH